MLHSLQARGWTWAEIEGTPDYMGECVVFGATLSGWSWREGSFSFGISLNLSLFRYTIVLSIGRWKPADYSAVRQ